MKNNCHVHTAPTDTDQIYIYKHVQSGENQLQPTPTNTNRGNTLIQQTSLLEFVGVCLCGVNWPLDVFKAPYVPLTPGLEPLH